MRTDRISLVVWVMIGTLAWGQGVPEQRVADTKISIDSGFYDAPIEIELSTATVDAVIKYTLDGREPTKDSIFGQGVGEVYTEPILLDRTAVLRVAAFHSKLAATNIDTRTYLFLGDVIRQPAEIDGWPRPNLSIGQGTARHDYEMDPRIVGEGDQAEAMKRSLLAIPTMSLVVQPEDMWNGEGEGGFYRGDEEAPVQVEVLYPNASGKSERARGAVQGHSHDRLKRSLRLKFKAEFGDTKFKTDLLQDGSLHGNSAPRSLDRLVLRAGNNRSWARSWNPDRTAYTMDEWYRTTQITMSGYGSRGAFVHMYINELYWGLYNVTERPDRWFTSEHFGGEVEDWYAISHGGDQGGDNARWNVLINDIARSDLSDNMNYEALLGHLDVAGFIDYLLLSWYVNLTDWPTNNWWAGMRYEPPSVARFFAWDGEWSFGLGQSPGKAWVHPDFLASQKTGASPSARLWHGARQNADFMMLVADRAYRHLIASDGALTDAVAKQRWQQLNAGVKDAAFAESARWGDAVSPNRPRTVTEDWQHEVDRVNGLLEGNGTLLIDALIDQKFYPAVDPPEIMVTGDTVSLVNPNQASVLYVTIDGTDPRVPGGEVSQTAFVYQEPFQVSSSTRVQARALKSSIFGGSAWTALASSTIARGVSQVRISRLMYHPADPSEGELAVTDNDDDFEFVEVVNMGTQAEDLSGWRFAEGIIFQFPEATVLFPNERAMIVRHSAAFHKRYGESFRVLGEYRGSLSNRGERLSLLGKFDEVIHDFIFSDDWVASTDGEGTALEVVDLLAEHGTWNDPNQWQASDPTALVSGMFSLTLDSLNDQEAILRVMGNAQSMYLLEMSLDLNEWQPGPTIELEASEIMRVKVPRPDKVMHFFRARALR